MKVLFVVYDNEGARAAAYSLGMTFIWLQVALMILEYISIYHPD